MSTDPASKCVLRAPGLERIRTAPVSRSPDASGELDVVRTPRERAEELVAAAVRARVDVTLLDGGNHYFDGRRHELAACLTRWLDEALAER